MYEYTHKNHFKFGYRLPTTQLGEFSSLYQNRTSSDEIWSATYGSPHDPRSWREENAITAGLLWDLYGNDLYVFYSGGIDSEIVIQSFIDVGIVPRVVFIEYKDGYNKHEKMWVDKYVSKTRIQLEQVEFDLLQFWETEVVDFCMQTQCVSPQLPVTMKVATTIRGIPIIGQGECFLEYTQNNWWLREHEKICAWYKFFMFANLPAIPGFFQYTPNQLASFIPRAITFMEAHDLVTTKQDKCGIYRQWYPELVQRPKYSGFELVEHLDSTIRQKMREIFQNHENIQWTPITNLL